MLDLIDCSLRKALNLTYQWLRNVCDPEDWKRDFADLLDTTTAQQEEQREAMSRWADPDDAGRGKFILKRIEDENQPSEPKINFDSVK